MTKVVPSALQMLLTDSKGVSTTAGTTASAAALKGTAGAVSGVAVEGASIASTTASASGWLGLLGKGFGTFGALTGVVDLVANWGKSTPAQGAMSGAAIGAALGSVIPGLGTAVGGAVGALAGGLLGSVKTGKHQDQKARDLVRAAMVEGGFLTSDYKLPLANGQEYNMGYDGGPKSELGGRRPFEVDFNAPLAAQSVAWINPIADLITGGDEKLKTDFAGYLANAAMTGAQSLQDVAKNIAGIMERLKVTPELLQKWVIHSAEAGKYSEHDTKVHLGSVASLAAIMQGRDTVQ